MREHTDIQIIKHDGKPAFAVVPYEQWLELTGQHEQEVYYPHEVVGLQLKQGLSLLAAWRVYKKLTQKEMAEKLGVSQPTVAQMEKSPKPQNKTLEKWAEALGVDVEQLKE